MKWLSRTMVAVALLTSACATNEAVDRPLTVIDALHVNDGTLGRNGVLRVVLEAGDSCAICEQHDVGDTVLVVFSARAARMPRLIGWWTMRRPAPLGLRALRVEEPEPRTYSVGAVEPRVGDLVVAVVHHSHEELSASSTYATLWRVSRHHSRLRLADQAILAFPPNSP